MKEKWFFVLKTAIFLIFSFALLGTVIIFLGKERPYFKKTFILKTQFRSVAGLSSESPVYRYGLRVGHVADFQFLKDGRVEVIMRIEKRFHSQFHKDCYAKIVPVGILGDKAVDIVGGKPDTPILAEGSVINSVEPITLEEIASRAKPLLDKTTIIAANLAEITDNIKQEHATYQNIFRNIAKITDKIARGEGTLGALVQKEDLYKEMTTTVRNAGKTMYKAHAFITSLQQRTKQLKPILSETQQAASDLTTLLAQIQTFIDQMNNWIEKTQEITEELSYASAHIKIASEDLPIVMKNFRHASQGAVEVIEAAKKSWFIRRYLPKEKKKR